MVARPAFTAPYNDSYTVFPTCSCWPNYNRNTYDPLTNSWIVCGNRNSTHRRTRRRPTGTRPRRLDARRVWLTSINMSNNTMNWQGLFWGGVYKNAMLTGGVNKGFSPGDVVGRLLRRQHLHRREPRLLRRPG